MRKATKSLSLALRIGFKDPAEFGFKRLFKDPDRKGGSEWPHVIPKDMLPQYLDELRMLMRKYLDLSEKARDSYYLIKQAYAKEQHLGSVELDAALQRNTKAQKAVSDNIMYDRWATKYAAVLQAEIAYATFMGWGTP